MVYAGLDSVPVHLYLDSRSNRVMSLSLAIGMTEEVRSHAVTREYL